VTDIDLTNADWRRVLPTGYTTPLPASEPAAVVTKANAAEEAFRALTDAQRRLGTIGVAVDMLGIPAKDEDPGVNARLSDHAASELAHVRDRLRTALRAVGLLIPALLVAVGLTLGGPGAGSAQAATAIEAPQPDPVPVAAQTVRVTLGAVPVTVYVRATVYTETAPGWFCASVWTAPVAGSAAPAPSAAPSRSRSPSTPARSRSGGRSRRSSTTPRTSPSPTSPSTPAARCRCSKFGWVVRATLGHRVDVERLLDPFNEQPDDDSPLLEALVEEVDIAQGRELMAELRDYTGDERWKLDSKATMPPPDADDLTVGRWYHDDDVFEQDGRIVYVYKRNGAAYGPDHGLVKGAKWDWWTIGGRWLGALPLKPGTGANMAAVPKDRKHWTGAEPVFPDGVDQAPKGAVDIDRMRREAAEKAEREWASYEQIVATVGPLPDETWSNFEDKASPEFKMARKAFGRTRPSWRYRRPTCSGGRTCPARSSAKACPGSGTSRMPKTARSARSPY
jgi:hypothetical protein